MPRITLKKVSKRKFLRMVRDLEPKTRYEVLGFIEIWNEKIALYMFGRFPGHRIYKIVLDNGGFKVWEVKRKR